MKNWLQWNIALNSLMQVLFLKTIIFCYAANVLYVYFPFHQMKVLKNHVYTLLKLIIFLLYR